LKNAITLLYLQLIPKNSKGGINMPEEQITHIPEQKWEKMGLG